MSGDETAGSQKPREHVAALDGVRGIAILLVLATHLTPFKEPYHGIGEMLLSVADVGWCGVDLFFVLSAFLITTILIETKGQSRFLGNFYARRILRISPLYYAVLVAELLLLPRLLGVHAPATHAALGQQWALWTYCANLVPDIYRSEWLSLGHLWSLSMEEQYYVVWAFAIALLPGRWHMRALLLVGSVVVGGQLILLFTIGGVAFPPFVIGWHLFSRFDGFIAGSALALLLADSSWRPRILRWSIPLAAGSGAILLEMVRRNLLNGAVQESYREHTVVKAIVFPLLAIFFVSLVAVAIRGGRIARRIFGTSVLRFLGKYSYGIYMFHGLLLPWFAAHITREWAMRVGGSPNRAAMVYFTVGSAVSVLVAVASYHLFEVRALRLKQYFGGIQSQAVIPSGPPVNATPGSAAEA